jgi:hypothetical protein
MKRVLVVLPFVWACAEGVPDPVAPPPRVIEAFWLAQAMGEVERPPPPETSLQSISLGYVGDAPLTGGMMQSDQPEADEQPGEDDDSEAAPELLSRRGTLRIGTGTRRRRRR